ncbi:MAG TPA: M20 family metallopeptidase [Actinomycetota bacterium]|jgi:succinyl-diaminopimelate desuccinylase|nr:M20 family metallopeptidase [Actinomycetota bacterium]
MRSPSAADLWAVLDRERLQSRLARLVQIPSENPPGNELEAAELTAGYCRELGFDVELHEADAGRPSVVARRSFGEGPTLAFCSHIDVVPAGDPSLWRVPPYGAVVEGDILHGRGSADAKGPIAAALEAVALLLAADVDMAGTLELDLVADEEAMGFRGAGYLVEQGIVAPDVAVVGEPTSLRVVRAQRGANWFRIYTHGLAGHGSAPERGINAIKHMAEIVLRLEEELPDVAHDVLGAPTLNVGTIAGGEKVNIIPAACVIEVDRRTIPGETGESVRAGIERAVERAKERFPDLNATVESAFSCSPFEVSDTSPVVTAAIAAVGDATDRPPEIIGFRGASDARFLFEAGADVIVLGPGDIALAHTAREHISLDELAQGAVAYALTFARLLDADSAYAGGSAGSVGRPVVASGERDE